MDYSIEPVRKRRISEEVFHTLKRAILDGVYKPGDRLPREIDLADELGVGKSAVGEALRTLEILRFIESPGGSGGYLICEIGMDTILGPFVDLFPDSIGAVREVLQFRVMIESGFAKIAAHERDDRDLEKIETSLEHMAEEIESGKIGIIGENEFHEAVAAATHNQVSLSVLKLMREILTISRKSTLIRANQPQQSLEDHRRIYKAIRNGDAPRAGELMGEHLRQALINLRKTEPN
jgi:GntR family transcriptional repressor for pyruvate dehydrogenase complex